MGMFDDEFRKIKQAEYDANERELLRRAEQREAARISRAYFVNALQEYLEAVKRYGYKPKNQSGSWWIYIHDINLRNFCERLGVKYREGSYLSPKACCFMSDSKGRFYAGYMSDSRKKSSEYLYKSTGKPTWLKEGWDYWDVGSIKQVTMDVAVDYIINYHYESFRNQPFRTQEEAKDYFVRMLTDTSLYQR